MIMSFVTFQFPYFVDFNLLPYVKHLGFERFSLNTIYFFNANM